MVLYELCKINRTSFALVHFSDHTKTYVFPKNEEIPVEMVLECAETFLDGGTNFDNTLREVNCLILDDRFEKPDVVFITDGICDVSDEILNTFEKLKLDTGTKLTGILLDQGENLKFTLQKFADRVYRTSELLQEQIVENLMEDRI